MASSVQLEGLRELHGTELSTSALTTEPALPVTDERLARRIRLVGYAVLLAAAVGLPWVLTTIYDLNVFVEVAINAILATGLAIVVRSGRMSLAQATFGGIGGYTSGILVMQADWSYWPALVVAGSVAALFGILLGLTSLRLRGFYFAIATFAFSQVVIILLSAWTSVTGGYSGMFGLPYPPPIGPFDFSNSYVYYYFALLVVVLAIVLYFLCSAGSRFGRSISVLGEDELLAGAMGVPATPYRLAAFAISSFVAGIGGSLNAHFIQGISPSDIAPAVSVFILVMVMAGGSQTLLGPVVGAAILTAIPELLRASAQWSLVFYGAFLLLYVYFFRSGLLPLIDRWVVNIGSAFWHSGAQQAIRTVSAPEALTPATRWPLTHGSTGKAADILVLDQVRCAFGDNLVLNGISLAVPRGELRGIIGPNGAGKTTLFNVLTGHAPLTGGSISLDGMQIRPAPARMARHGIARTFQHPRVLEQRTVRQALQLAAEFCGRNVDSLYVEWLTDFLGLRPILGLRGAQLSHYRRRLVTIAMAAAMRPNLMLLDEPLAGLDETETARMKELIRALHRAIGCTTLLIEHKLSIVMELCARLTVLDGGQIIADGDPTTVSRDEGVLQAYLGS